METKKITSTLLAAGIVASSVPAYAYESSEADLSTTELLSVIDEEDSFASSVAVTGQTDTSISIKWSTNDSHKSYSVSVNGIVVADSIDDDIYNITGLQSANEYYISVNAYDEEGTLLISSDEICAHTNLTLSSNFTLTNDIKAANVYVDSGTLNLNGHTLTVSGDTWVRSGYLKINKGKLYTGGNLNLCASDKSRSTSYLTMENDEDYVCVNGNMHVRSYYNYSTLTAGILEIKGDFTQKTGYYSNNFYASGTHKVILSGEGLQTVSFDSTNSQFNVVEITKPIDTGYVFSNAKWNELIENFDEPTPPTAPYDLTFIRSTSTSIVMKWNASIGLKDIFCYQIYRNGELVGTTTKTEYIDNGLTSHTKYEYYVVAVDVGGSSSDNSSSLIACTDVDQYAPTTPTGLAVKIREDGSVYATWIASSDNVSVDGYNIYRNGEFIDKVSGTSYKYLNVEPGYHEYYVEAFDNEGNTSLFSASAFIDNMPPKKPVLSINDISSTSITFSWISEDNVEIQSYKIYKNDEFILTTDKTAYIDNNITAGGKYSYYVVAVDTSGNISEPSETASVKSADDTSSPKIVSISCAGGTVSDALGNVTVRCSDDVSIAEFTAEIKAVNSDEWTVAHTRNISQSSVDVSFSVLDYLSESGKYNIRVSVSDYFGNTAVSETEFEYVKNELKAPVITASVDGCTIEFCWSKASESDSITYMVYRIDPFGNKKYLGATTALDAIDYDIMPLSKYTYYVVARDNYGNNVTGEYFEVESGKDTMAPKAYAGLDIQTLPGIECNFDASRSTDNYGIVKYEWSFGDGTSEVGEKVTHKYSSEGVYYVELTVTDESGNTASDTVKVTVYPDDYCIAEIQVMDTSNSPIPGATVYYAVNGTENTVIADSNGVVSLVAPNGTYDFYFFANDYIPSCERITLSGISTGANKQKISLVMDELVTAKFEIKELTFEEIEDLGIDVSAPENQHVCHVIVTVKNSENNKEEFNVLVDSDGDIITVESNGQFKVSDSILTEEKADSTNGTTTKSTSTSTLQSGIKRSYSDTTNDNESSNSHTTNLPPLLTTMVSLSVTEYSWMKDFYEISITITNNSSDEFVISDCTAKINLPEGLSLAPTENLQSEAVAISSIPGGSSSTVKWTVRGDSKGSYIVSVDFNGILNPFEIPVQALFTSDKAINVSGGDDLLLTMHTTFGNTEFTLENVSDSDIYNAKVTMKDSLEFNDAEYIVLKYPSGLIEKIEWADNEKKATNSTFYLPVTVSHNADILTLRTLEKGQKIEGIIYYSFREKDE